MKLLFFVESIRFTPERKIPSVIVELSNRTENIIIGQDEPDVMASCPAEFKSKIMEFLNDVINEHHTSLLLDLSQYKKSEISVGDILEVEVSKKNKGEISQ